MQDEGITKSENLEICPNCMEPNSEGSMNCAYCGKPMQETLADQADSLSESEAANRGNDGSAATDGQPADGNTPRKKQEKGGRFYYLMRGMGVYLILTAFTEIPRSLKIEDPKNRNLALLSNLIYIIAGGLLVWPLVKDFLDKRKKKREEASAEIVESTALPAELPQPEVNPDPAESSAELTVDDTAISEAQPEDSTSENMEKN